MTALEDALNDYLTLRRAVGYKLGRPGQLLAQFVGYLDGAGVATVTIEHAVAWATQPVGADPSWWAYRLDAVRGFALYLHTLDSAVPALPRDLLPYRSRRATPYLYSDDELAALLAAAGGLPHPLRADTCQTMIALLAVTGIRIGEAISLDVDDLDSEHGLLVVREGKFGKTRQLPLHTSTVAALADYLERCQRLCPRPRSAALFLSGRGSRVCHCNISATFHELTRAAGLAPRSARCRPRLHDLRHTFAVRTVLDWYRAGVDVQARMPLLSTYRPRQPRRHLLVSVRRAGAARAGRAAPRTASGGPLVSTLAPTLQAFFTDRLMRERHASPNTIAAYRDTMRLLLAFAEQHLGKQPSRLELDDLDAKLVGAFLDHLEYRRGNSIRTRNARLAAIHSLFRFAALQHPEHAAVIQRVLAIPVKRFERVEVTYLTEPEVDALLAAPDRLTWTGRRDHTLLLLAVQTGLRASELTALNCGDVHLGSGAHISCHGKGRKDRATPLTTGTAACLRTWLQERHGQPSDPLFPTSRGRRLSRDALEHRLAKYVAIASGAESSLAQKRITLHVLRHTAAMRLLHAGVDTTVIALWLGHETVDTTQIYLHAHLALKERALARTAPPGYAPGRYRPPDTLLAFLEGL